jgi:hypothetical protein
MAALVLASVAIFCGGLAAGCGSKTARKPKKEIMTVNGKTMTVYDLATITLNTTP